MHRCRDCGEEYASLYRLYRHEAERHDVARYACDVCDCILSRPSRLKEHCLQVHNKNVDVAACRIRQKAECCDSRSTTTINTPQVADYIREAVAAAMAHLPLSSGPRNPNQQMAKNRDQIDLDSDVSSKDDSDGEGMVAGTPTSVIASNVNLARIAHAGHGNLARDTIAGVSPDMFSTHQSSVASGVDARAAPRGELLKTDGVVLLGNGEAFTRQQCDKLLSIQEKMASQVDRTLFLLEKKENEVENLQRLITDQSEEIDLLRAVIRDRETEGAHLKQPPSLVPIPAPVFISAARCSASSPATSALSRSSHNTVTTMISRLITTPREQPCVTNEGETTVDLRPSTPLLDESVETSIPQLTPVSCSAAKSLSTSSKVVGAQLTTALAKTAIAGARTAAATITGSTVVKSASGVPSESNRKRDHSTEPNTRSPGRKKKN